MSVKWTEQSREEWLKSSYKSKSLSTETNWQLRHAIRCGVGLSDCRCGWKEYLQRKEVKHA